MKEVTNEQERRPGPRGEVGKGKPGRRFRRRVPHGRSAKSFAHTVADGKAWLKRKAG